MTSGEPDAFANRDAPIPVVQIHPADDDEPSTTDTDHGHSHHFSATKLKDKLESLGLDNMSRESTTKMGDKMINLLLSQVLPHEDLSDTSDPETPLPRTKDRRSHTYVARPNFSLPTMSSNFRRFNARIGVAFVFQNRLIRLFTWAQPTQTLSFLLVWTFLCTDPYLLPVLPLACGMFFVMVPAYLARHPEPEGSGNSSDDVYRGSLGGPPLADARTIKPAPEFSKDFFRNMRDLQNSMEDFSRAHDAVLAILLPLTNFSNEALSSTLYLLLLLLSVSLFIVAHLLPWRAIALLSGYSLTALGHPRITALLSTPETEKVISDIEHEARSSLLHLSKADIDLLTPPTFHTVEIFELQHRSLPSHAHSESPFEPLLFSPSPYAPLSPARISGDRPRGTPFFEDVLPPRGWRWCDKKWTLDLLSQEWVEERCVTGVEVEVEGERWVTDLWYEGLEGEYGGGSGNAGDGNGEKSKRQKLKKKMGASSSASASVSASVGGSKDIGEEEKEVLRRTWESHRPSRRGEWRRRRWIRGVERMPMQSSS